MNSKGYTVIEVLVALAIGLVTVYMTATYVSYLGNLNAKMKLRRITGNTIHSYAESVRFNLSLYQVAFDNSVTKEKELLNPDTLPLGISRNNVVPRAQCATVGCQAYFGYVIIPSVFVRNLYELKFKVASPDGKVSWDQTYSYYITNK